ncbi:hypothetical protein [Acinetobacter bereziniae]|uniref:hypothetical protein n=2 Tax=Acinetobacter bereziniae TaxID=106648 RepID=UPI0005A8AE70|nr:hypothetical protein [Acinetobacter bereziniae]
MENFLLKNNQNGDIFKANIQPKNNKLILVVKDNVGNVLSGINYKLIVKNLSTIGPNVLLQDSFSTNSKGETRAVYFDAYLTAEVTIWLDSKKPITKDDKNGVYRIKSESYSYISTRPVFNKSGDLKVNKKETIVVEKRIDVLQKAFILYQVFMRVGGQIKYFPKGGYRIFNEKNERLDASSKQIKSSVLNEKSISNLLYTDHKTYIEFDLNGIKFKSPLMAPLVTSTKGNFHPFEIKLSSTTTNPKETYTASLGAKTTLPIIIVPKTNEIYILPMDVFKPFDKLTKDFEKSISSIYKNKKDLELQLEARNPTDIKKIEERLGIAKKDALDKINGEFKNSAEIQEVLVIEASGNSNGNPNILRRYANKRRIEELRTQRINKSTTKIKITSDTSTNAREGTEEINTSNPREFNDSLKKFINGVGVELASYKSKSADEKSIRDLYLPVLGRVGGEYSNQYNMMSENDELTVDAQWMRFVGTNGTEATLNLSKEHLHGKAEAKAAAKFVLFEGRANWDFFWPSKYGWSIVFDGGDPIATIRVVAGAALQGFAGANLAIAGQTSVAIGNVAGYQKLQAISHDPKKSMKDAVDAVKGLKVEVKSNEDIPPDVLNKAQVEVKAFAGAQLALTPKVELQWFNANGNPRESSGEPKFETLAKAAVTAGVSGGAGAEFNFYMYIHTNGSIRIKLAAHLCYGIGAKGAVDLEVNPKDLVSLMLFIKKNLLKMGFMHLAYIATDLFEQLSQLFAMLAANNDYTILKKYSTQLNNISDFLGDVSQDFRKWTATIKSEEAKLACAQNINNNLQSLIGLTPNSKGILVYSLCHWNTRWAHYDDFPAIDWDGIHYLDQRKTAIVNIFKSTLHVNEWRNIIERVNQQGKKSTGNTKNLERHIINFLASGLNLVRFQIENIVLALNNNTKYTGPTNKWIKDFIEARTSLEGIKTWPLPQIAYNQDDSIFKQVKIMQGYDENNEILYLASANDKPLFSEPDNDTYLT